MKEFLFTTLFALAATPELLTTLQGDPRHPLALLYLVLWLVFLSRRVERSVLSQNLLKSSVIVAVLAQVLLLNTLSHLALVLCFLAPVRPRARWILALSALSWLPIGSLLFLHLEGSLPFFLRTLLLTLGLARGGEKARELGLGV